ncbi:Sporulation protein YpjB (SpoYpjB) [Bacillus sp. THAF10]|uniref:sporulation protein YpjB n=1 Tax=Bacillus sp. THAF10 TaxID=2587848 RepID=UPI0012696120|nr:sporulation protein YpjB [Bacillus sp. THAF10]QFT89382.1 Sporulation protein YpjB (SpoYpjB) [Bacillus sp. THAF10]
MIQKLLLVIILFITLWTPINGQAHSHEEEVQSLMLNFIMDDALWLAQTERYIEAHHLLEIFSEEFTKMMAENPQLQMAEVRIISVAHQQTLASLSDTTLPHEEKIRQLKKMRLVVDAMTSKYQPMWVAMEDPIIMTFQQLKDTIDTRDAASYQQMYQRLLLEYDMIHPSVRMDIKPEQIQKVDAHMEYLDKNRDALLAHSEEFNDVEVIEADLKALFKEFKEDETDPALLWVMISTGSIILLTLFYVGFRKYFAARRLELRKKQKD